MPGQVIKNIVEYMNAHSVNKTFNYYEISTIRSAVRLEWKNRKETGLDINTRTRSGRGHIDQRVSDIANEIIGRNAISPEDVRLYKKCFSEEYTDRTGRCAWGFKEVRRRLGFDEETGLEICTE